MTLRQLASRVTVATLVVIGILLGIWLLIKLQALVVLVLIAVVFATGIAPLVERMERHRIPRASAIILVYLIAFLILSGIGAFLGTIIVNQSIAFSHNFPDLMRSGEKLITNLQAHYKWLPNLSHILQDAPRQLGQLGSQVVRSVPQIFGFLGSLVSFISIIVINFYILMAREELRNSFLGLIPESERDLAAKMFCEMGQRMGGWLRGQILLALIVGVSVTIGLAILQIPYAGLIGLVAALAELIPMVGPAVAAIPTVLITLIAGHPWQLISSLIFFTLLSQVDSNYLTPRIMQKQVGLSPLTTILALLAGATLMGAVGALLAIPLAAAVQVLFETLIYPAIQQMTREKKQGISSEE